MGFPLEGDKEARSFGALSERYISWICRTDKDIEIRQNMTLQGHTNTTNPKKVGHVYGRISRMLHMCTIRKNIKSSKQITLV